MTNNCEVYGDKMVSLETWNGSTATCATSNFSGKIKKYDVVKLLLNVLFFPPKKVTELNVTE